MAKNRQARDDEAWTNAKKICRLTPRQVEMARALRMNPSKLPRLRPSPQQRWKLPVGEFIEECYRKRLGDASRNHNPRRPESRVRKPSSFDREGEASECVRDPMWQVSDLTCYFTNLADDLQKWLGHRSIDAGVLGQVREELREIANALDTGAPISPIPEIPLPPQPKRRRDVSRERDREPTFDDDEIPF
jgi:hypothetical protein